MDYKISGQKIIISLPLTTPTGKVRVKRPSADFASEPVASREHRNDLKLIFEKLCELD